MIRLVPYLVVFLLGGVCMWVFKDSQIQAMKLEAAQELLSQRDLLISKYEDAVAESKRIQEINRKNTETNKEKLREALEENDSLRTDLVNRPVIVRIKAGTCPSTDAGNSDATSTGVVSVEVAEDLRRDIFRLRESILRDQAALKERDDWIALVSQYSLQEKAP